MITGDIRNIKVRCNKNREIKVEVYATTFVDIDDPDEEFEEIKEKTILTGDCLGLDFKKSGSGKFYFKIYTKLNGKYKLDRKRSLYIGCCVSPQGNIEYSISVTNEEYQYLKQNNLLFARNKKIGAILTL